MYRLVLYVLISIVGIATLFAFLGLLPFSGFALLFSTAFLLFIGWITNALFASVFSIPANEESVYISALILALIISPITSFGDLPFLFWAAVWTMASKFIVAAYKKHVFNPVAFAVFLTSITISKSATWWIGTSSLLPFVVIGGYLIAKKIRRLDLVVTFLAASFITIAGISLANGTSVLTTFQKTLLDTPWIFFATVMLTEPLTTPPTKTLRLLYGALVGFLFAPQIHLGSLYTTPESALLLGNIFSYIVSPKEKLLLTLKEKIRIAPNIYDFVFNLKKPISFRPGQYMEWTFGHPNADKRGNRRYFTLASSPTELTMRIGVRFYDKPSSFKQSLLAMTSTTPILAGQLAGDFVLPNDPKQKIVFIAGGIGVTPYRSMVKYLLDTHQSRSIILLYANKTVDEIVYTDVFEAAKKTFGMKTVYTLTDKDRVPPNWSGSVGRIDPNKIQTEIPDYKERIFYISGPNALVTSFEELLRSMGIPPQQIKTDFFPGFA